MVRQKKILFVLCTHSLIVIVVHAQSVMTLGLGGGSIVFPETIYNRNDVILKETPYFSPEGMLDFYFENKIFYHHLILRGGYNQLARNSVSIPEHETPGGALREWPYYGKDSPAGPSRARTCDHLIMSQVSNSYNSPSSNHNVNICKIKGYELSASIPAIAQAMYGIYRTAKYDSESSPISYT